MARSDTLNGMGATQEPMTCQQLVELVTDYFEGALTPAERDRFDAHLQVCPGCEDYLEQMRITMRLVHDANELDARPEVAQLLELFRDYKRT
jgi:predicted anti-sigma-YlaC factor YlaD